MRSSARAASIAAVLTLASALSVPTSPTTLQQPIKLVSTTRKQSTALVSWGMDAELWEKVENKRNLVKLVNRGEEDRGRARIEKLRALLVTAEGTEFVGVVSPTAVDLSDQAEVPMDIIQETLATEPEAGEVMEVACPSALPADRTVRVSLPDLREFDVVVPEGVAAGEVFLVGPFPSATEPSEAAKATELTTAGTVELTTEMTDLTVEEQRAAAAAAAEREATWKRRLAALPRATMVAEAAAAAKGLLAVVGGEDMQIAAADARRAAVAAKRAESGATMAAALASVEARIAEIEASAAR